MSKHKFGIIFILILIIIGSGIWSIKNYSNKKTCDHCNILMLDIDILRADELPCYGYFRNTAPNICKFAKKSVSFMDNYSTSYWTFPSIFSTITSLYPTFHQVQNNLTDKLSSDIPTLAETLKKEGYKTVLVNENKDTIQLMNQENGGMRGYDLITTDPLEKVIADLSKDSSPWFIHFYSSDLHLPYLLPENIKPMENMPAPKNFPLTKYDYERFLNTYLKKHYAEIFKKKAIDEYGSIIFGPDKPNDTSVTDLFNISRWDESKRGEYLFNDWDTRYKAYMETFDKNNPADVAYVRMIYDTKLNRIDNNLKTLLEKLDSKPLSQNTITVITSDHGENFGEHGLFSHDPDYHSELFYTPLIIHSPLLNQKQIKQPTSNVDIFPTIIDMVGINKLEGLQGQSLVPYIQGIENNSRQYAVSEYWGNVIFQNHDWMFYLPFNATSFSETEFYNKIDDPLEKSNVIEKYPDLAQSLYKQATLLRSYDTYYDDKKQPISDVFKNIDPQKLEKLRKEGYF